MIGNIQVALVDVNSKLLFNGTTKGCDPENMNTNLMKELAARVVAARIRAGIKSQKQLAELIGVSQQTVQQIESGKTKHTRYIKAIAEVCGVSAAYLQYGDTDAALDKSIKIKEIQKNTIPLLCDSDIIKIAMEGIHKNHEVVTLMDNKIKITPSTFGYEVINDAMTHAENPTVSLCIGEVAIIDKDIKPSSGDIILALVDNGVKLRQFMQDGNDYYLDAHSSRYERIKVSLADIKIIGTVIGVQPKIRILKQI